MSRLSARSRFRCLPDTREAVGHFIWPKRLILVLLLGIAGCTTTPSQTPPPSPLGTWRILHFSRHDLETGEDTNIKGDSPTGYLIYTAGGHMVVWIAGDRGSPAGAPVDPDLKRLAWFNGIISGYSGTYSVTGNQITHHVESAWVPDWCGTDQIRYFKIDGRTLTITTAPMKSTFDGRQVVNTLVFERVE